MDTRKIPKNEPTKLRSWKYHVVLRATEETGLVVPGIGDRSTTSVGAAHGPTGLSHVEPDSSSRSRR